MKKIIFGLFSQDTVKSIKKRTDMATICDTEIASHLRLAFKDTYHTTKRSIKEILEHVGLPKQTSRLYKSASREGKTLLAAVVPLEMEDVAREMFRKFQANNVSTINCP